MAYAKKVLEQRLQSQRNRLISVGKMIGKEIELAKETVEQSGLTDAKHHAQKKSLASALKGLEEIEANLALVSEDLKKAQPKK